MTFSFFLFFLGKTSDAGKYGEADGLCQSCPARTWSPAQNSLAACTPCLTSSTSCDPLTGKATAW